MLHRNSREATQVTELDLRRISDCSAEFQHHPYLSKVEDVGDQSIPSWRAGQVLSPWRLNHLFVHNSTIAKLNQSSSRDYVDNTN